MSSGSLWANGEFKAGPDDRVRPCLKTLQPGWGLSSGAQTHAWPAQGREFDP